MAFIGAKPTNVPLTSSDLQDSIITSAKIVDGTIATADISDGAVTSVKTTGVGGDMTPAFSAERSSSLTLNDNTFTDVIFDVDFEEIDKIINENPITIDMTPIAEIGSMAQLNQQMQQLLTLQSLTSDPTKYQAFGEQILILKEQMNSLTGETRNLSAGLDLVNSLANNFVNSFGQGMANIVVQGEKLQDVLRNIGRLLLSSAIQLGIQLLLTGGTGGSITGGLFGALGFGKTSSITSGAVASAGAVVGSINNNNMQLSGDFRVKGSDLVLSLERANQVIGR